jgi:antitoxin ParD1/3/4
LKGDSLEGSKMNILLTSEWEQFVTQMVEDGAYPSASEVIYEGLRLLKEHQAAESQRLAQLKQEIALGIEDADQGNLAPLDARATLARVRARTN